MRHENNFGEVRLPDSDGLRFQLAITDPWGACECVIAWIGQAGTMLDAINDGIFNDVIVPAGYIQTRPGIEIHEAAQKLLNLMIVARRELIMVEELVNRLLPLLPHTSEGPPPLRRAVIDLREKAWDHALAEYTAASTAGANSTGELPAKLAALLATPAPTVEAFLQKFGVLIEGVRADGPADGHNRLLALVSDYNALMQRQARGSAAQETA